MTAQPGEDTLSPRAIAAEFRTRLMASLEMLCGASVDVVEGPAPPDLAIDWRSHPLGTTPPTELYTATPEVIGQAIGARVLAAAGLEDFSDEDVAGSYTEVLRSALSAVAQYLGRALGEDVALLESGARGAKAPGEFEVSYQVQFDDQTLAPLYFGISASLLALLEARASDGLNGRDSPNLARPKAASPSARVEAAEARPAPGGDDLSRVLDLELPIRVRFGKASVALKDVLKLSTGSIVELDRSIHDPVEIVVNDRVIGRGEVVVTEGNYGVRIQEIISLGPV